MTELVFFSGSRADYGLIKPILIHFKKKKFNFELVSSSHHTNIKFGNTKDQITDDEVKINFVSITRLKDTKIDNIYSFFLKSSGEYFKYLNTKKPKAIFILGDRYEAYAFSLAAYFLGIPIIHMHGGEVTQAAFDEGIRHSISKLSNLHFVIHNYYKKRLIMMGENPKTVFNFGSTACNEIKKKIFPR
jgi:UDP-hydrolysing UDP-N-acetyl-D-glucosamine 2-epimerase